MTQIVLHAHLSADAILRGDLPASGECLTGYVVQAGHRVLSADQIRAWCGRDDVSVVVKPVIDLRERLDHVIPFDHRQPDQGGPTATDNLAPLCRRHHRLKTRGRWRYQMTMPGVLVWTSPHGHQYLRDHTGSRPLGHARRQPDPPDR